jgi:hypothetical protein
MQDLYHIIHACFLPVRRAAGGLGGTGRAVGTFAALNVRVSGAIRIAIDLVLVFPASFITVVPMRTFYTSTIYDSPCCISSGRFISGELTARTGAALLGRIFWKRTSGWLQVLYALQQIIELRAPEA